MTAYYNEHDPFAAAWLRELIKAGHIAPGVVDERSIEDVIPSELAWFTQCHFFAGIGVWSYALRCAGWPDERPVWTGSCPCQPFSAAGKGAGFADERHLWPAFHHLIESCRPLAVFGEQVASKDGLAWLDLVSSDLEGEGYAFGAIDSCAAGFGAPHIRQRLYWVADSRHALPSRGELGIHPAPCGEREAVGHHALGEDVSEHGEPRPTYGHWQDADWLLCRDGKWRAVEPAFKQMADGIALVMGYLRDCGAEAKVKEAINEATGHPYTAEVLREVRSGTPPEVVWVKVGGQVGFYAATVLLSFLLKREGKLGNFVNCTEKGGAEECARLLRGLRGDGETACSPLGPEHPQQFRQQLENAMSSLPQTSALEVLRSLNGSPLAHGATNRVGRLRGYGNAIVAPQAQAFIEAYMSLTPD